MELNYPLSVLGRLDNITNTKSSLSYKEVLSRLMNVDLFLGLVAL
jgi:hypothetical protein